jgi:outer membrane protein TolC
MTAVAVLSLTALAAPRSSPAQSEREGGELTLAEAVSRSLETYPSLAAARAAVTASQAAVSQASSDLWPRLQAEANLTRFQEPMLVAPLHGLDLTTPPSFNETLMRGDIALSWTLYDGGARGARIRAARAEAAGTASFRRAVEQTLISRVAGVYLEVLAARGVRDAQERRIAALESERGRVQQLFDEGRAARVELLRVDAALANARAEHVATAARLDLAERELARLVGGRPDSVRADRLVPVHLAVEDSLEPRGVLVSRALDANPELERARTDLAAMEAEQRVAVAAWIPRIGFFGMYQGFSGAGEDVVTEWQAGANVSYALFTGGERTSAIRAAGARVERAREELRLAELETAERVDRALSSSLEARARVEAVAQAVQHQSEVVRIELLSLQAGAGTQTDYLRAEADLLHARSALIEARHAEIAARFELARVLGELTPRWLAENVENSR